MILSDEKIHRLYKLKRHEGWRPPEAMWAARVEAAWDRMGGEHVTDPSEPPHWERPDVRMYLKPDDGWEYALDFECGCEQPGQFVRCKHIYNDGEFRSHCPYRSAQTVQSIREEELCRHKCDEMERINASGMWGLITEWWNFQTHEYEEAYAVWGFIADDWKYDQFEAMDEAMQQFASQGLIEWKVVV